MEGGGHTGLWRKGRWHFSQWYLKINHWLLTCCFPPKNLSELSCSNKELGKKNDTFVFFTFLIKVLHIFQIMQIKESDNNSVRS